VDADGSYEGYGVIGVTGVNDEEHDTNFPDQTLALSEFQDPTLSRVAQETTDDLMGDVRLIETAISEGRRVETGPCLSGTRRIIHGSPLYSATVILITASGNIWGTLSFNDREIFYVSSLEQENGHKNDSAAVNLSMRLRMRRRRWPIASIGAIYLRRYRHRDTAIEVFFKRGKHRSFFVDFSYQKDSRKNRDSFAKSLFVVTPSNVFKQWLSIPIHKLVQSHQGEALSR
jgi:hypothetical protein